MAEDQDDSQKTEQPSQKRLKDAEEKGDVAQSPEIATFGGARCGDSPYSDVGRIDGEPD